MVNESLIGTSCGYCFIVVIDFVVVVVLTLFVVTDHIIFDCGQ